MFNQFDEPTVATASIAFRNQVVRQSMALPCRIDRRYALAAPHFSSESFQQHNLFKEA